MKTSYKSRIIGSVVVLVALLVLTLLVLNRRQPLPKGLAANDDTHRVLSLPLVAEQPELAWHARQNAERSPQAPAPNLAPVAAAVELKPVPTAVAVLQVASFGSIKNALTMRKKLITDGYSAHIKPVHVHNKTWYRLQAGPFDSVAKAKLAQRAIAQQWKLKAKIRVVK